MSSLWYVTSRLSKEYFWHMFPPLLLGLYCCSFDESGWARLGLGCRPPPHTFSWASYLYSRIQEERWLNGSAPDCNSVVLGLNPAPPQHMANSVSPEVGSHLGWHRPLRGGRGNQYTQKPLKIYRKKNVFQNPGSSPILHQAQLRRAEWRSGEACPGGQQEQDLRKFVKRERAVNDQPTSSPANLTWGRSSWIVTGESAGNWT